MQVKAWNKGNHSKDGNGYGVKISIQDRDIYFRSEWKTIIVELEGETSAVEVNINKKSFWNETCRELISVRIGRWLLKNKLAPWTKGNPPILKLIHIVGNQFKLSLGR
jgi:hypothetical protein